MLILLHAHIIVNGISYFLYWYVYIFKTPQENQIKYLFRDLFSFLYTEIVVCFVKFYTKFLRFLFYVGYPTVVFDAVSFCLQEYKQRHDLSPVKK